MHKYNFNIRKEEELIDESRLDVFIDYFGSNVQCSWKLRLDIIYLWLLKSLIGVTGCDPPFLKKNEEYVKTMCH